MFKNKCLETSEERMDFWDTCKIVLEQSGIFNTGLNTAFWKNSSECP